MQIVPKISLMAFGCWHLAFEWIVWNWYLMDVNKSEASYVIYLTRIRF